MTSLISAAMFKSSELAVIIVLAVSLALLIALNVVLYYVFHRIRQRRLCTNQLQDKREELLKKLEYMRLHGLSEGEEEHSATLDAEEEEELEEELKEEQIDEEDEDDDSDDDEEGSVIVADGEEADGELKAEILAVRDMSAVTRERLGYVGDEYRLKRYYVRYTLGFEAKLREAEPEVQQRYKTLVDELGLYKGVKIKKSFRQQRIYKGRKTLGLIMFRGKTLCVAFALDPAEYAETKYRGIDKSDKKRFAKTPMLYRISSDRRAEYAKYLILQLADINAILLNETPVEQEYDFNHKTRDAMFVDNEVKITVLGEAPDLDEDECVDPPAETPDSVISEERQEENAQSEEMQEENAEEDVPEEEIADEDADDIEEVAEEVAVVNDAGEEVIVVRRIRYNRSFTARITQIRDEVKDWYTELKNTLLSYNKVKSSISWKRERFSLGRVTFASFVVRGKTLCLCLATDPKRFDDTKYKVIDLSVRSPKSKQPCMYRISSERRVKYAKQIIAIIMAELGVDEPKTFASEKYQLPYRTTEALILDGLIRIVGGENASKDAPFSLSTDSLKESIEKTAKEQPVVDAAEDDAEYEQLPERDFEIVEEVDVSEACVMSDEEAERFIEEKVVEVKKKKGKKKQGIVNINSLSENFEPGAHVTISKLREKKLISSGVNYIKVLANGVLNKPLIVEADDFSIQAAKMILLTGGRVIKIS